MDKSTKTLLAIGAAAGSIALCQSQMPRRQHPTPPTEPAATASGPPAGAPFMFSGSQPSAPTTAERAATAKEAKQDADEERAAIAEARVLYASQLEKRMIDRGSAVIIRAQGRDNRTLHLKMPGCSDVILNAFVKGDGFQEVQPTLEFQRVECTNLVGESWGMTLDAK